MRPKFHIGYVVEIEGDLYKVIAYSKASDGYWNVILQHEKKHTHHPLPCSIIKNLEDQ